MHLNEFPLWQCSFSCCEVINSVVIHEKGFSNNNSCFLWEGFSMSVWYLLRSVKMVKDIDVSRDVVFVICMIYGSMRDMDVKDNENMRL